MCLVQFALVLWALDLLSFLLSAIETEHQVGLPFYQLGCFELGASFHFSVSQLVVASVSLSLLNLPNHVRIYVAEELLKLFKRLPDSLLTQLPDLHPAFMFD